MKHSAYIFLIAVALCSLAGCAKFVSVDSPVTSTNADLVFNDDAFSAAALTDIYTRMSLNNMIQYDLSSLSVYGGLSADELTLQYLQNPDYFQYYTNNILNSNTGFWSLAYRHIGAANAAIEGLASSTQVTPAVRQELTGEAKFVRAFCYFYLVNLYGDVPMVTGTDYKISAAQGRTAKAEVYKQIIADLKEAKTLLSDKYLKADATSAYASGAEERVRPTKWATSALLARTYLYTGDYKAAEAEANLVISNTSLFGLPALNEVFLKNSKEAIWQLQPVRSGVSSNTPEGKVFILPAAGPGFSYPVYLSDNVVNAFEAGDQRKTNWTNTVITGNGNFTYPYKYKIGQVSAPVQEYSMVMRLGEIYLIRAEARAQQDNVTGAQEDLNAIRNRAGLGNTPANDQESLLVAVAQERRVELFTEWGHRWLDLKRTGKAEAVMSVSTPAKGGTWQATDQLYPVPLIELQKGVNLEQNLGY